MSVLNHVAYIRPTNGTASSDFLEKLSAEGFSYVLLEPLEDYAAKMAKAYPAAILIDAQLEPAIYVDLIGRLKELYPHTPLVLVAAEPLSNSSETASFRALDAICHMDMPSAHLAITLRGVIRSSFIIQDLMRSIQKLNEISITDTLTGLYNRFYMMHQLNAEFKRAERSREILSCLMIDIDHFKSINDTYGHKFGDIILKAVASRIRTGIRGTDIFGRYGGEEFLIVLPNTDLEGAALLADKLRASLDQAKFKHDYFALTVTASFGAASTENPEVITPDHLLQLSDRALYRAKESGRNKVCVAGKEMTEKEPEAEDSSPEIGPLPQIDIINRTNQSTNIARILRDSAQYAVKKHSSVEDFTRSLREQLPRLVVVDNAGNDQAVIDACALVKKQLHNEFIPLIAILQSSDPTLAEAAARAGAEDVIQADSGAGLLLSRINMLNRLKDTHDRLHHTYSDLHMARSRLVKTERLNALGEMATGIAHDFNNILSAILGRTQLLRQRTKDMNLLRNLEVIERAANDGAATIRRIQEFSGSNISDSAYHLVDMAQVIQDSIQMTRTRWKDKAELEGIQYSVRTNFQGSLTVLGSATELREVVTNLILNSLDAMVEGGALTFQGQRIDENVVIMVADSGIGMDEEVLKRIFDPFFSTKRKGGSGLGLSVTYGIIMRHNGRIECSSEKGHGSVFRIQLPFKEAPVIESSPHRAEAESAEESARPFANHGRR